MNSERMWMYKSVDELNVKNECEESASEFEYECKYEGECKWMNNEIKYETFKIYAKNFIKNQIFKRNVIHRPIVLLLYSSVVTKI